MGKQKLQMKRRSRKRGRGRKSKNDFQGSEEKITAGIVYIDATSTTPKFFLGQTRQYPILVQFRFARFQGR